ncbi:MAG: hypothetical protein RLZZ476_1594, partial [Verrucomicrobiota bacterium]
MKLKLDLDDFRVTRGSFRLKKARTKIKDL